MSQSALDERPDSESEEEGVPKQRKVEYDRHDKDEDLFSSEDSEASEGSEEENEQSEDEQKDDVEKNGDDDDDDDDDDK